MSALMLVMEGKRDEPKECLSLVLVMGGMRDEPKECLSFVLVMGGMCDEPKECVCYKLGFCRKVHLLFNNCFTDTSLSHFV